MLFSKKFIIAQALFAAAVLALGIVYLNQNKTPRLPVYGTVGDFKLKDQDNKDLTLNDLKGKVWVADFIFTTCGSICPMMTAHMSGLSKAFAGLKDVRMVSISVNPENDTPATLKIYAQKYGAQANRWSFLSGPRADIQTLIVGSFKIGDMKEIIFHSPMFVLVDRKGQIRGYYDSTEEERLKQLFKDLPLLERER